MASIEDPVSAPPLGDSTAGRLTTRWQVMIGAAWVAAFFAFASVWKASEEIGIGTWWLGPRAQPQPTLVRIIPFALTVAMVTAAMYNVRRLPESSLVASLGIAMLAAFDISRSGGLAAIEFAIAASLLLVSLASLTGRRPGVPVVPPRPAGLESGDALPPPTGPPA